jgi:hypothetical protein
LGHHAGRAPGVLHDTHLANDIASAKNGEDDVAAIGLFDQYLQAAANDDVCDVSGLLRREKMSPGTDSRSMKQRPATRPLFSAEAVEQRSMFQYVQI